MTEQIKISWRSLKFNLQSFKSTLQSLRGRSKAFEKKPSLVTPAKSGHNSTEEQTFATKAILILMLQCTLVFTALELLINLFILR